MLLVLDLLTAIGICLGFATRKIEIISSFFFSISFICQFIILLAVIVIGFYINREDTITAELILDFLFFREM